MLSKAVPTLRPAKLEDATLLADFAGRAFSDAFGAQNNPEDLALYLATAFTAQKMSEELTDKQAIFFLAEIDNTLAGYAKLQLGTPPSCIRNPKAIELARLYAGQPWIGCGVGAALMKHCIAYAHSLGQQTLWLGVWEKNLRAQNFYRKWNFEAVGQHIFWVGNDPQTDFIMERTVL